MRPFARNWDVQGGTGYASSTVARGQWYRGALYRAAMPALSLPPYNAMRDPSWSPAKRGRR